MNKLLFFALPAFAGVLHLQIIFEQGLLVKNTNGGERLILFIIQFFGNAVWQAYIQVLQL
jgi:hypothetical protein